MRGSIRKRGRNSWELRFEEGPRINGKRRTRHVTMRGTRQDAQKELTRLLADADTGKLPDGARSTVAERIDAWLAGAHNVAPKTRERYGELANNQIIPHLGAVALNRIKSETIRAWHAKLLERGLAPRTILHAHRVLGSALAGTQARSALTVDLPLIEDGELEILEPGEIWGVLEALKDHWLLPIASLALSTGARRGELLGLVWADIDLDRRMLRIERSVEELKSGLRLKTTKTKRSRRTISLPPEAAAMMRAYRIRQLEQRLILGLGNIEPSTLIFSTVDGGLMRPRNVTKAWSRIVTAHSFHSLRHTHASMLIRAGVDILTISRRLGHSKAAITLDVYGHLIPGADKAAADAIAGVLK
jgi:integrase